MRQVLLAEIQRELAAITAQSSTLQKGVTIPKLYEVFVLSCLTKALRSIGAKLEPRDSNDNPTSSLIFRLGPGVIYRPSSSPGFILVTYNGTQYEIQNGLQVTGRSKVMHELDICLVEREAAIYCRKYRLTPAGNAIKFLAECKYYGKRLDLGLGREYLGLSSEFSLRVKTIVSNVASDEIHNLVTNHKGTENFNVTPSDPANVERFISWVANELRQVL